MLIVALILAVAALLIFTDIQWANLLWIGILGLLVFRHIKNRKNRMLKKLVSQVSKMKEVRAIRIQEDSVTVVVDKAQASLYIRVNSQVDDINKKLYFGRPVQVAVRDNLSAEEFQHMLREPGIAYVRDDVLLR
jgi:hypothetical protein